MASETAQPVGVNMAEKPFAQLKGDERRWAIESAASTLKAFAKLNRPANKELKKAAREELKREIADGQKTLKTT